MTRLMPARLGGSKWHIVGVSEGADASASFANLQSAIAFDDMESALAYIATIEAEEKAANPEPAPIAAEAEGAAEPEQAEAEPAAVETPAPDPTPDVPAEPATEAEAVPEPVGVKYVGGVDIANGPDYTITTVRNEKGAAIAGAVIGPEIVMPLTRPLSIVGRIRKRLQGLGVIAPDYTIAEVMENTGIKSLGDGLWFGAFTNNFRDRDGEIIRESALDGMIERMRAEIIPYPELWRAHKWYTKHGAGFFVARAGNIVYAVGHFDKTRLGSMMEQYYKANEGESAMSHGFTFPEWGYDSVNKTYSVINTFEVSTLPPHMAANLYTPFKTIGNEVQQMLTELERKELEKDLPPAIVAEIAANHKALESASGNIKRYIGAEYKDFVKVTPTPAPPPAPAPDTGTDTGAPADAPAEDTDADEKADVTVDADAFGVLLNDMMTAQVDSMNLLTGMAERMNQQDALIREMAAALGYEDVPASESPETVVEDEAVAEASAEGGAKTVGPVGKAKAAIGKKAGNASNAFAEIDALSGLFEQ